MTSSWKTFSQLFDIKGGACTRSKAKFIYIIIYIYGKEMDKATLDIAVAGTAFFFFPLFFLRHEARKK